MSKNEKHENVTPVDETEKAFKEITDELKIPDEQLDKVAGGYARRPAGEKVKCNRCEGLFWPSDLTGGYCGKCAEAIIKEGRVILI